MRSIPGPAGTLNDSGDKTNGSEATLLFGENENWIRMKNFHIAENPTVIADVANGSCDLVVDQLFVLMSDITRALDGNYSLTLMDPSGSMQGFMSRSTLDYMHSMVLANIPASSTETTSSQSVSQSSCQMAVVLSGVSIFVQRSEHGRIRRSLCVTSDNVMAVYHHNSEEFSTLAMEDFS